MIVLSHAFKQYPAAFKHTPTILHTTHFWRHPVYPLSHINWLSQISVMSRCFAQILPRYFHFDFSLICCIVMVCCTRTISLCSPTKGETGHPKKFVRAHWIHAELSFVCTTPLSIHLKASAHSLTPTESSSLRHKRKVLCHHSHKLLLILFPEGRTNLHKPAVAMNLYIFKFTTFH